MCVSVSVLYLESVSGLLLPGEVMLTLLAFFYPFAWDSKRARSLEAGVVPVHSLFSTLGL